MATSRAVILIVDKQGYIIDAPKKWVESACASVYQRFGFDNVCVAGSAYGINERSSTPYERLVVCQVLGLASMLEGAVVSKFKVHGLLYGHCLETASEMVNEGCVFHMLEYKKLHLVEHMHRKDGRHQEEEYLNLMERVLTLGQERCDRTGTGTVSLFGEQVRFDISEHIPVLTTKNVPWRLVIEELLWFMRGDTDSGILEARNVNIWRGNTSREFLDGRGLTDLPEGDSGVISAAIM